jgi:hypothetical protein
MILDELKDKSTKEIEEFLTQKLEEYTAKVEATKDIEVLKQMELDIDKEQEALDQYLKEAEYQLNTEGIEFEGKHYSLNAITKKIVYHLNRIEQDFQYCLGLHGLVLFWKRSDLTSITYGAYDSTLRLLGGLKYKGDSEWTDILIINNYLVCAHEPYIRDRSAMMTLAQMRSKVIDRIQLCSTASDAE